MDLGTCAPGVTAGRAYTMGAWYQSSGPVVFNAYYRTATGAWRFWVTSPPLAASRGWTRDLDGACRARRGDRGQLRHGTALGRHAGHHPVQPGPGPLSYTRLIVFVVLAAAAVIVLFGV